MAEPQGYERQALDDWFIYGPKDPEIALLVQSLVTRHGLRTAEVENMIREMLAGKLADLEKG